jgi:hypothetical protein
MSIKNLRICLPKNLFQKRIIGFDLTKVNKYNNTLYKFTNTNIDILKSMYIPQYSNLNYYIKDSILFQTTNIKARSYMFQLNEMSKYDILYNFSDIIENKKKDICFSIFTDIYAETNEEVGFIKNDIYINKL